MASPESAHRVESSATALGTQGGSGPRLERQRWLFAAAVAGNGKMLWKMRRPPSGSDLEAQGVQVTDG